MRHTASVMTALLGLALGACAGDSTASPQSTGGSTDGPTVSSTVPTGPLPTAQPGTTPTASTTTAPTTTAPIAADCIAALPLAVRAGQVVWPAVYGDELARRAPQFAEWGVGGTILMTWTAEPTATQLQELKQAGALPLLVATDEEGGSVQRLDSLGVLPSASKMASTMTAAQVEALIADHAVAVKALGVDIVFAPVVDVGPPTGTGPIGSRVYGNDPDVVITMAGAVVRGWQSAGILPVLKHFPGHGAASADTHDAGATTASIDALRARDLLPYAALADSGAAVMVGHLDVPGLTDDEGVPASLSTAAITDLLRGEYGYADALVFTDALGMNAIIDTFTMPEAAVRAIAAGADVVIFTNTDDTELVIDQLIAAVDAGRITQERLDDAVGRILVAKRIDPCALR